MRGGGAGKDGAVADEDGSVREGPECMPIGRGRSGGGVRLRPVSGMRGEGGGVLPRGAGASGALVVILEPQGAEDGLRFVWRASFYGTQWQQHPVPFHLRRAGH